MGGRCGVIDFGLGLTWLYDLICIDLFITSSSIIFMFYAIATCLFINDSS